MLFTINRKRYFIVERYEEEDGIGHISSRFNPATEAEFTLVNPSEEENKNVRNLPATLDMVCWWDVAKDIDMVQTHIDMFKKFKIS